MKKDIYELNGLNDRDIRRIEKALGLYEGTINTDAAPPRASENGEAEQHSFCKIEQAA